MVVWRVSLKRSGSGREFYWAASKDAATSYIEDIQGGHAWIDRIDIPETKQALVHWLNLNMIRDC